MTTKLTEMCNLIVSANAHMTYPKMDNSNIRHAAQNLKNAVKIIPILVNEEAERQEESIKNIIDPSKQVCLKVAMERLNDSDRPYGKETAIGAGLELECLNNENAAMKTMLKEIKRWLDQGSIISIKDITVPVEFLINESNGLIKNMHIKGKGKIV